MCSEYDQEYIGETARMLGTRLWEHTDGKHNSAIAEHTSSTSHCCTLDDTKILVTEDKWFPWKIQEALHIHKLSPALNRDRGHSNSNCKYIADTSIAIIAKCCT